MANRKIKHIVAKLVGASTEETLDVYDIDAVHTDMIANNLTTTNAGYVLDARQGKALNDSIAASKKWISLGAPTPTTALDVPSTASEILATFMNSSTDYRTSVLIATNLLDTTQRPFSTGFYNRSDVYCHAFVSARLEKVGWFRYVEQSGSNSYDQTSSSVHCYCYCR